MDKKEVLGMLRSSESPIALDELIACVELLVEPSEIESLSATHAAEVQSLNTKVNQLQAQVDALTAEVQTGKGWLVAQVVGRLEASGKSQSEVALERERFDGMSCADLIATYEGLSTKLAESLGTAPLVTEVTEVSEGVPEPFDWRAAQI